MTYVRLPTHKLFLLYKHQHTHTPVLLVIDIYPYKWTAVAAAWAWRGTRNVVLATTSRTCTGVDGPASLILLPWWSMRALTLPQAPPATKMSPTRRVPRWIRTVPTVPAVDKSTSHHIMAARVLRRARQLHATMHPPTRRKLHQKT